MTTGSVPDQTTRPHNRYRHFIIHEIVTHISSPIPLIYLTTSSTCSRLLPIANGQNSSAVAVERTEYGCSGGEGGFGVGSYGSVACNRSVFLANAIVAATILVSGFQLSSSPPMNLPPVLSTVGSIVRRGLAVLLNNK
ncbi:hypothetical protein BJ546DRAFT_958597 [Cryomyces antarcticus]